MPARRRQSDSGIEYTNRHFFTAPRPTTGGTFCGDLHLRLTFFLTPADCCAERSARTERDYARAIRAACDATGNATTVDPTRGLHRRVGRAAERTAHSDLFNTAAFATNRRRPWENAGTGIIVAPGLYLWDVSLRKTFR